MSSTIQLKRSAVASKVPTTSDVALGELAMNTYDGLIYFKKDSGTPSIVTIVTTDATQTLSNKTLSGATLSGTLTANGSVGTAGQVLASNSTGLYWTSVGGVSGTNLTLTANGSTVSIDSDTGTDVIILAANSTTAGVLTAEAQTIGGTKTFSANTVFNANVGIQTSSPAAPLDVSSGRNTGILLGGDTGENTRTNGGPEKFGGISMIGYSSSDDPFRLISGYTSSSDQSAVIIGQGGGSLDETTVNSATGIYMYTAATPTSAAKRQFFISSSGKIAVGESNVENAARFNIKNTASTGDQRLIGFEAYASGDFKGRISINESNDSMRVTNESDTGTLILGAGNSDRVYVCANGNVGIATSSPTSKLDVTGTSAFSDNAAFAANVAVTGTITSGTWNGSLITSTYGGTGVNNGSRTITIGGNVTTANSFTTSGNFALTLTQTAATNVTLPTSGTLVSSADTGTVTSTMIADGTIVNADINASANIAVSKLAASTISGVTLGNNLNTLTLGTYLTGTSYNGSANVTAAVDATTTATASKVVARDASGNFAANTITAALTGNASTATTLQTARTITLGGDLSGSVSFDGSANVTLTATVAADSVALGTDTTGNYVASITNGSFITGGNGGSEGAALTLAVDATSSATASKVVSRDASGNFSANTITAALTGNASTATTLQTARNINGISFNGSADITITANTNNSLTFNNGGAGVASGNTFNGSSAVTVSYNTIGASPLAGSSSLTTTGTITSGTWNGSVITGTYGGTGVNNGSNTITIGGNVTTANSFTTSGNFALTLTQTAATNVTLPTTGTLATLAGTEQLSGKTLVSPTISGNSTFNTNLLVLDGTSNTISVGATTAYTTRYNATANTVPVLQIHSFAPGAYLPITTVKALFANWSTGTVGARIQLAKSKGGTPGTHTVVADADTLSEMQSLGSDGTEFVIGTNIASRVDGTPAAGYVPARIAFSTSSAANTITERATIAANGNVGIATTAPIYPLDVSGAIRSTTQLVSTVATGTAPLAVTSTTRVTNLNAATAGNADTVTNGVYTTGDQTIAGVKTFSSNSAFSANAVFGATTMAVDSANVRVTIGSATSYATRHTAAAGGTALLQVNDTGAQKINALQWSGSTNGARMQLGHSRGATAGTHTALVDGDSLGDYQFVGSDGTTFVLGGSLAADVDGTVTTDYVPTALLFRSSANTTAMTTRMKICANGNVGIGLTNPTTTLAVTGTSSFTANAAFDTLTLFVDATNRRVGIGNTAPAAQLQVTGSGLGDLIDTMRITHDNSGATYGPTLLIYRNSASPAASDQMGAIVFRGNNSAGNPAGYGYIQSSIVTPTATSEDGKLAFAVMVAGTQREVLTIDSTGVYENNVTSGAGAVPAEYTYRLTANSSAQGPAIFDYFGTNSSISLEASSVYEIEAFMQFTKTTANTATWTLATSSAPTRLAATYIASPITGNGAGTPVTAFTAGTTTAVAFNASGTLSTGIGHTFIINVRIITNAATNFRFQLTQGSGTSGGGTATPLAGSYYTVKKISATTGTFAA